jgi:hypothetical protein
VREEERQRLVLRDMLAGHVNEEVLGAYWFMRGGLFGDDWRRPFRAIWRAFSGGRHAADRLGRHNVFVLTPTRVVVFAGRYARGLPPVELREELGSWAFDAVELVSKRTKLSSFMATTGSSYDSYVLRATLTVPGEERPIVMDFPYDKVSRELMKAAKERVG